MEHLIMTPFEILGAAASVVVIIGGVMKCWQAFEKRYRVRMPIVRRDVG